MIGRYLAYIDDYLEKRLTLANLVRDFAAENGVPICAIDVNSPDNPASGRIYLTVTGTSAEAGDDGQVGRGNRVNDLITPCQPMSFEAAAGKTPATHVGKFYNVAAPEIAETVVAALPQVARARCLIVSQIGAPMTSPAIVSIKLGTRAGHPVSELRDRIEAIAADRIARIPDLVDDFVAGAVELF